MKIIEATKKLFPKKIAMFKCKNNLKVRIKMNFNGIFVNIY